MTAIHNYAQQQETFQSNREDEGGYQAAWVHLAGPGLTLETRELRPWGGNDGTGPEAARLTLQCIVNAANEAFNALDRPVASWA